MLEDNLFSCYIQTIVIITQCVPVVHFWTNHSSEVMFLNRAIYYNRRLRSFGRSLQLHICTSKLVFLSIKAEKNHVLVHKGAQINICPAQFVGIEDIVHQEQIKTLNKMVPIYLPTASQKLCFLALF